MSRDTGCVRIVNAVLAQYFSSIYGAMSIFVQKNLSEFTVPSLHGYLKKGGNYFCKSAFRRMSAKPPTYLLSEQHFATRQFDSSLVQ